MRYYMLASGSTGNCTALVNDENEILLIDCGISVSDIKNRLESKGLDFNNIRNLLITHTHTDHVKSIRAFDDNIIYINEAANMPCYHQFDYYQTLNILGFEIYTLPISHDAPGTTGFLIKYKNEKMAYITDAGYVHENIQAVINNCDIYCVESNHDPRMLMMTRRPAFLKQRILSANGHLSNEDCAYMLGKVIGPKTKEIVLLHRSQEANSEDMIKYTFKNVMDKMKVDYSSIKVLIAKAQDVVCYTDETEI